MLTDNWNAPEQISPINIQGKQPHVCVDQTGNTTAVWFRFDLTGDSFSNVILQSISKPSGGSWGTPIDIPNVSGPSIVDPDYLQLSIASYQEGSIIIGWTSSYNASLYNTEWKVFKLGKWYPADSTSIGIPIACSFGLDINFRNNAFISYMEFDSSNSLFGISGRLFNLNIPAPFSEILSVWTLSNADNNAYPFFALNYNEIETYGITSWTHYNGENNEIQTLITRFPIVEPPSDLSVARSTTDYGVFVQNNNTFSWSASPSEGIQKYVIYRNDIFLAMVPDDTLSYIDVNVDDTQMVTYSIYAYGQYGFSSSEVEVQFQFP
ncbi:MAG: hypothetical protein HYZ48_03490 [Chlamydiales bacterium]|nr:hypothetical protein [Chlamydiales bacterium]